MINILHSSVRWHCGHWKRCQISWLAVCWHSGGAVVAHVQRVTWVGILLFLCTLARVSYSLISAKVVQQRRALEERVLYCGIVVWWALVQVSDSLISGREPWLSRRAWQEMASHIPTQYTTKPRHQYTTMSIHQYNATHTRYPGWIAALPHTSQQEATQLLKSNVARGWSINWGGRVLRYNSGGRESQVDRMYYRASLHRCTITPSQYAPGWHHRSIGPKKLELTSFTFDINIFLKAQQSWAIEYIVIIIVVIVVIILHL